MYDTFLKEHSLRHYQGTDPEKRSILIFHCEFSSERAPKMSRFVRNHDRTLNKDAYPSLYFPEIYLLHNGYKEFYHTQMVSNCYLFFVGNGIIHDHSYSTRKTKSRNLSKETISRSEALCN